MKSSVRVERECALAAARAGDKEALGRLLEACRPYLLAIAGRELDSDLQPKAGASDLVEDACLNALRKFDTFEGASIADLRAWLRRTVVNRVADVRARYRDAAKRDVRREISLDTSDSSYRLREHLILDTPGPDGKLAHREDLDALQQALARLPEDQRRVLELRHEGRRTFEEIGAEMGRSADAARMLYGRAVARLGKDLGRSDEQV